MPEFITLPDGSTYGFTYEQDYGLLKTMTLPTGETVTFTYANFTDAYGKKNRWLTKVTRAGADWTYTQATCGTACNKVTVRPPSGNDAVYTFGLNQQTAATTNGGQALYGVGHQRHALVDSAKRIQHNSHKPPG